MTDPTWRDYANAAIRNAYQQAIANGLAGKDIIRAIDAAYPFGERECHPYKIWLSARKEFLIAKGLIEIPANMIPDGDMFKEAKL